MKQSTIVLVAVACAVLFGFCLCAGLAAYSFKNAAQRVAERKPQPQADAATQAERKKVLASMPFAKIDERGLWVRPAFYAMTFDEKEKAVNIAWCWAYAIHPNAELNFTDNGMQSLLLLDERSGKQVGRYGYTGLKLE